MQYCCLRGSKSLAAARDCKRSNSACPISPCYCRMVVGICAGNCGGRPADKDLLGQDSIYWHCYHPAFMGDFHLFPFNPRHPDDTPQCNLAIHCAADYSYPCLYNGIARTDLERLPNSYCRHVFGTCCNPRFLVLGLLGLFQYSPSRRNNIYPSVIQTDDGLVSQAEPYPADRRSDALGWKCSLCNGLFSHSVYGSDTLCSYD